MSGSSNPPYDQEDNTEEKGELLAYFLHDRMKRRKKRWKRKEILHQELKEKYGGDDRQCSQLK